MSIYGGPDIITNNLTLHLDAANNRSYPGSGNKWYDISGNNRHFTLSNNPSFSNGRFTLNGTNQYITSDNNYTINTDFSINLWINNLVVGGGSCPCPTTRMIFEISSGYGDYINMYTNGNTNRLDVSARSNSTTAKYLSISSNATSIINTWTYLTITYSNTTQIIYTYRNGILTFSNLMPAVFNLTNLLRLGAYTVNCGYCYSNMLISNFSIYNKLLSTSEILQNYNASKGRFGL